MQGVVIRSTGSWYEVRLEEDGQVVDSRLKGKFRQEDITITNPIAVGDKVMIEMEEAGTALIDEILPRKNGIIRQSPKKKHLH